MGNSACCSVVQDEQKQELIVIMTDTIKSQQVKQIQENCVSFQLMDLDKKQQILCSPVEKQKGVSKNDDPSTPAFSEGKSQQKEQSLKSNKMIALVADFVLNIDEQAKYSQQYEEEKLISQSPPKKRQKKDSPRSEFQPKNSFKLLDLQQIALQKSLLKARTNSQDMDMSSSVENYSIKSVLKLEKKYSKYLKHQTQGDLVSSKIVHFQK